MDTVRVECSIPRTVYERLIAEENVTSVYRTRVAARVLCNWAKSVDGS